MKIKNCKCEFCKEDFYRKPSAIKKMAGELCFCSKKCWSEWKKINIVDKAYYTAPCSTCGKPIRRLISKDRHLKTGKIFCDSLCKRSFSFRNKYKGLSLIGDRVLSEFNHRTDANKYASIRSNAKIITLNREQICYNCGWDKHVEVSHIKDICLFDNNTLIRVINDNANLLLLCPNCHWEFDNWKKEYKNNPNIICPIKIK